MTASLIPSGCQLLAVHGCDAPVAPGFTNRNNQAKVVTDPSRGNVLEATFKQGMIGGTAPVLVGCSLGKKSSVYLGFDLWYSPNFQTHLSGVNKVYHCWINGSNRLYLATQGPKGYGPMKAQLRLQGVPTNQTLNLPAKVGIVRGVWSRWELVLTPTSAYLYVNGVLSSGGKINFGGGVWEKLDWNPTWGGRGDKAVATMTSRIDAITVYGK